VACLSCRRREQWVPPPARDLVPPPEEPSEPKKKPKLGVICGGERCAGTCCTTLGEACKSSPKQCATAANGEVTFAECDGPEDCGAGKVCCLTGSELLAPAFAACAKSCGRTITDKYGHVHKEIVITH
jgi:hypothetical protein